MVRRLANVKAAYEGMRRDDSLLCREASYEGCHVLKLQRPTWANGSARAGGGETGIFFAIWVNSESVRTNRVHYNIHALKLRNLRGFKLTSREFAAAFRARFERFRRSWPNVSIEYGPQNLMQGWIEIDEENFEADAVKLMMRFHRMAPIIDRLLAERRHGI